MLTDLFEITEASVHFSAPFQMYLFGKVNNTQEKFHFGNFRKVNSMLVTSLMLNSGR